MNGTLIVSALLLCSCVRGFPFAGDATISVLVIDEQKQVIPEAVVLAGWTDTTSRKSVTVSKTTDENGIATFQVGSIPEIRVNKVGYYRNGLSWMVDTPALFTNPVFALNHPKVEVVLQRRVHPSPMIVRKVVEARIPKQGEGIGYDLVIGDWVKPHGSGESSDLVINMSFSYRANRDYDYQCRVSFSNPGDGILLYPERFRFRMNEIRLPREAPGDGYENGLEWNVIIGDGKPVFADRSKPTRSGPKRELENDNYIFRVRSKRDETNGDVFAMYGKIHGAITPGIRPFYAEKPEDCYAVISFHYYLNPSGKKSLEWDMENNLANQSDIPKEP